MPGRIEDYALVGDLQTAALVGLDGSVDWLCLPRFDSAACFSALLDDESAGRWRIAPTAPARTERRYRPGSLVLETDFATGTGSVRLVDCMPPGDGRHDLVRLVQGLSGEVEVRLEWRVRLGYGRDVPWVRRVADDSGDAAVLALCGPDGLALRGEVEVEARGGHHEAVFTVREGETVRFAMTWFPSHEPLPPCYDIDASVRGTDEFWLRWSGLCGYEGPYREAVVRSLVTLKALTYEPTGGIVAAPTTSLPETFGGSRNWDYRYCWLRDATLTLWALLDSGYTDTAAAWRDWLLRAVAGDPEDLQIMYGAAGERRLEEYELPHLTGYEGSSPVRVGNAASTQFQLDVYGEVMNALSQAREAGVPTDAFAWAVQRTILDFLSQAWRRPDASLWEMRGEERHFVHSKLLCWVAFDRGVEAVEAHGLDGDVQTWRRLRDEVRADVLEHGWSDERQAFTQYYGGTEMDASVLMMPLLGFLPADDERMRSTVRAVEADLRRGPLVDRYRVHDDAGAHEVDGLEGREASFLACSFWLVENLARDPERRDEAVALFEELLALRNDVGLLAEEYDGAAGRQAGNFPQAFSHVALVGAALALAGGGGSGHRDAAPAGREDSSRTPGRATGTPVSGEEPVGSVDADERGARA